MVLLLRMKSVQVSFALSNGPPTVLWEHQVRTGEGTWFRGSISTLIQKHSHQQSISSPFSCFQLLSSRSCAHALPNPIPKCCPNERLVACGLGRPHLPLWGARSTFVWRQQKSSWIFSGSPPLYAHIQHIPCQSHQGNIFDTVKYFLVFWIQFVVINLIMNTISYNILGAKISQKGSV